MGFNPLKAVTRGLGIRDRTVQNVSNIFPVVALASGGSAYGFNLYKTIGGIGKSLAKIGSSSAPSNAGPLVVNVPGQQSYYSGNFGGGGGGFDQQSNQFSNPYDAWGLDQSTNPYGGNPWGSSMTYSTPSVPSYQVYSPAPAQQGLAWEDLAVQVLPFFL